jgi:hypothetical protein
MPPSVARRTSRRVGISMGPPSPGAALRVVLGKEVILSDGVKKPVSAMICGPEGE